LDSVTVIRSDRRSDPK